MCAFCHASIDSEGNYELLIAPAAVIHHTAPAKMKFTEDLYSMLHGWGEQTEESKAIINNAACMSYGDFFDWLIATYDIKESQVGMIYDAATDDD